MHGGEYIAHPETAQVRASHAVSCPGYADAGLNRALAATEISYGRAKVSDYTAEDILSAFPSNLITRMSRQAALQSSIASLIVRAGVLGSKSELRRAAGHFWPKPTDVVEVVHSSSETDHAERWGVCE